MTQRSVVPVERIEGAILVLRGHKVILDKDLAAMYGVETKVLVRAVKRNEERFPGDFMFQLTREGARQLEVAICDLKFLGWSEDHLPYVFTEQGVAMLSSVLQKPASRPSQHRDHAGVRPPPRDDRDQRDLARRLDEPETRYDTQFKVVFQAIRRADDAAGNAAAGSASGSRRRDRAIA